MSATILGPLSVRNILLFFWGATLHDSCQGKTGSRMALQTILITDLEDSPNISPRKIRLWSEVGMESTG